MIKLIKFNGGGEATIDIATCPFCGSDPDVIHQGNSYTKCQSIIIKCPNRDCRVERTDKVISHPIEWLLPKSVASWNRRPQKEPTNEG